MPAVQLTNRGIEGVRADAVVLPVRATASGVTLDPCSRACAEALGLGAPALLARSAPGFEARVGQTCLLVLPASATTVVLVGLGAEPDAEALRECALSAGSAVLGFARVATPLAQVGADRPAAVRSCAEGMLIGGYRSRAHRQLAAPRSVTLLLAEPDRASDSSLRAAARVAVTAAGATAWVRDLVERPAGELTPAVLAAEFRARAAGAGVRASIWTTRRLAAHGFGATLAVGAGSVNPPTVVELRSGPLDGDVLGLAGKGITFDAGGINLKRDPDEIAWMKSDMAGAAAVAAAVCAAADLGATAPVHAVLPLAENLPGPGALRPGDVVTHPGGQSTEVMDTDCEGRLVLADAIAHLARGGASQVVDVGTLTDGAGLGHLRWACWGNRPELVSGLLAAGEAAGDPGWPFPVLSRYRELFHSPVADRRNTARDVPDTAMMAATYLSCFAGDAAWAHLDNGGTAYLPAALDPWPEGATGSPTRALLELIRARG